MRFQVSRNNNDRYYFGLYLAEKRKELLVQRDDGAFWICYEDWVTYFGAYDICVLPTKFSDGKKGPSFEHEHRVSGCFQVSFVCSSFSYLRTAIIQEGNYEVNIKLQVNAETFVVLQVLLDCLTKEDTIQNVMLLIKDANGSYLRPALPTKFDTNTTYQYKHNGYLYNLAKGDYTLIMRSSTKNESLGLNFAYRAVDGRKWMIRAVSEDVSLQEIN